MLQPSEKWHRPEVWLDVEEAVKVDGEPRSGTEQSWASTSNPVLTTSNSDKLLPSCRLLFPFASAYSRAQFVGLQGRAMHPLRRRGILCPDWHDER